MKRLNERELLPVAADRLPSSLRAVMACTSDVVWQADAGGEVIAITPCRPAGAATNGELDEAEVGQVEKQWRRSVRVVERFNALFHVRSLEGAPKTYLIRAVPVLDERDAVLYWAGICAETDGLADWDTRFISEVASVIASSLNRTTIVNRLVQVCADRFCDLCAIHAFDEEGSLGLEAVADRRPELGLRVDALMPAIEEAARSRNPVLLFSPQLGDANIRSMVVAPVFAGGSCIGTLTFAETQRAAALATRDVDVAVVVARQLAMALENIKTFEREQHLTERFRFLARVTERLFTTLDPTKLFERLLEALSDGFADYSLAVEIREDRLRSVASFGTKARLRENAEREILTCLQDRRSLLVREMPELTHAARLRAGPLFEEAPPRSWMMVPVFVGDRVYGALLCCSNQQRYDAGDLELFEEVGRRASLALEHAESFARERRLIATLQQATLPSRLARVRGASISAVSRPASSEVQVGGDWYDAFDLDEHRVLLTVGDVTGHGLEASIVMGKLRHAINVVAMYESDPVRILDAAERVVHRRYPSAVATAFVAIFDSRDRSIAYANAGHPYPILRCADGTLEELEAHGLPIGLRTVGARSQAKTIRLADPALLALYTDGLIEASRDIVAGERMVREALSTDAVAYVGDPAAFVESYCLGNGAAQDDVAILLLNFVQSQRWKFDSDDWRAARRTRREFLESLRAMGPKDGDLRAAELILGELTAHVAQHTGGLIELALESNAGKAVLHVIDRANGDRPTEQPSGETLTNEDRGLWLVARLGARLRLETLPGFGTHIRAELPIETARK